MTHLHTFIAAIVVTVSALGSSAAITATEPLHVRRVLDFTFEESGLSALCGFAVYRHIEGLADATLFIDDAGNPLHEIDTSPTLRHTFFAPESGKSISYPGTGVLLTDYYPNGTAVATVDGHLTLVHVPGGKPLLIDVGRLVFSANVIRIDPDGLPVIGLPVEILFEAGVVHGSVLGACEALAP